jgi:CcmD family protein
MRYVVAGYGATALGIGAYAAWLVRRLRALRSSNGGGRR